MKTRDKGRRIEAALDREDWEGARNLIIGDLEVEPDNHWLLARLSTTYYEQRRYAKSLKIIKKAHELAPDCPLVLWDYAGALGAVGSTRQALKIYAGLIKKGAQAVGDMEPCGEGREWALGLLTDCLFRAAICWEHLGNKKKALRWLNAFLQARTQSNSSIYTPEEALKRIEKLSNGNVKQRERQFEFLTKNLLALDAKSA